MWTYEHSDELQHYGVIGMKWGVRRNSLKAYSKASKKADKLNSQKNAASAEVERLRKALAYAEVNSIKRNAKAEKWVAKMDKVFSEKNLSKIEAKHIEKGRAFRAKAYGEGSYAMGNHKPPKEMSDKQFSKYMNKSDKHYDEAENLGLLKRDKDAALRIYEIHSKRRKK